MTSRALVLAAVLSALAPTALAHALADAPEQTDAQTQTEATARAIMHAAGAAAQGASMWVELLRAGGPLTVAVAAIWFALRKDKEARDGAVAHAAELKEMNEEVIALVGAATQAQAELRGAVAALKDGLVAIERMIDRRQGHQ